MGVVAMPRSAARSSGERNRISWPRSVHRLRWSRCPGSGRSAGKSRRPQALVRPLPRATRGRRACSSCSPDRNRGPPGVAGRRGARGPRLSVGVPFHGTDGWPGVARPARRPLMSRHPILARRCLRPDDSPGPGPAAQVGIDVVGSVVVMSAAAGRLCGHQWPRRAGSSSLRRRRGAGAAAAVQLGEQIELGELEGEDRRALLAS